MSLIVNSGSCLYSSIKTQAAIPLSRSWVNSGSRIKFSASLTVKGGVLTWLTLVRVNKIYKIEINVVQRSGWLFISALSSSQVAGNQTQSRDALFTRSRDGYATMESRKRILNWAPSLHRLRVRAAIDLQHPF